MRLYYKPGACSLASRIVLIELAAPYEAIRVDTEAGLTETGGNYRAINPKGYVPALALDSGDIITENPAILQFLADSHSHAGLAPPFGSLGRARLQEWLNFVSSELHKAFSPFFAAQTPEGVERASALSSLERRIGDVERGLSDGRSFILGKQFSVADAYLFVVLNWAGFIGVSLAGWPHVAAYMEGLSRRPSVRRAMAEEGLVEPA